MEEKKNNALEKAEQIAKENAYKNGVQYSAQSYDNEQIDIEKEREIQKAQRQREKVSALREKNLQKSRLKQQRMQLKKDRQKEKEILKQQSSEQRARSKRIEKQAKHDRKIELRMLKSAERAKEQQARLEARQRRRRDNKGMAGWLTAVISLGIATLVLASVLTFTMLTPSVNDGMLEATYRKSFLDTVAQIDNVDLNLSKILATKDTSAMQRYLVDTAINSELAENDIQQLPLQDQSKYYTTKLINQIGDYSKYLNNKLINGEKLSASDIKGLSQLYLANKTLKESLINTVQTMGEDYNFSSMIGGGDGDLVISNFNELQNLSVQYPELIYDGPFSDGQNEREIKGLKGGEITLEQAVESFNKTFGFMGLDNVKGVGEASGDIACFNVQGEKDGEILYAQYSKTAGKLIMFSYSGSCMETRIDDDSAIEKAQEFLSNLGIDNMKPVWINLANNVYTINFAVEQTGVIVYPDLIKVRVCAETQTVIGIEARSYYSNHTERVLGAPKLSEQTARQSLSANIEVDSVRLALVPVGLKTEKLCYEFFGTYDDATYYIYIDAITGKQVEMFKVVDGTEGQLLI